MKRWGFLMAASLACAVGAVALTEIKIQNNAFVPQYAVVPKGEMVQWTNLDAVVHTSTSTTGIWDSGDIKPQEFYKRKFNKTGTYPYYCKYHVYMKGTVRVTETAVAPTSFGRVKALFR
ncbi:MAG: plastocyanin [candidate division Zixibacteria bacterium]|nr:plastocyanin [candidate division Zixibacteria bacterium]